MGFWRSAVLRPPAKLGVNVFDASALLVFLQGEPGSAGVEKALGDGGSMRRGQLVGGRARDRAHGRNWDLSRALLASYGVQIEAVTVSDAEWAARRWAPGEGLSLADRLCLALGDRLDADIWTADKTWGTEGESARSAEPATFPLNCRSGGASRIREGTP